MTRDEILNMPAGREMDALIAEQFTNFKHYDGRWWWQEGFLDELPDYSTDIGDAWKVVEKFYNHCMLNNVHGVWECYLPNGEGKSKSAPLAICRAALLAVMK